jgi:hypothetical protein
MDYVLVYLLGFATCAVALGTLWILRERERARVSKALREEIEILHDRDLRSRLLIIYLREGLGGIRNILGGRAMLPTPAMQNGQSKERLAYLRGRHYATASHFLGGSNEQQ